MGSSFRIAAAIVIMAMGLVVGCKGSSEAVREWQVSDHAQPAGSQIDPERVARKAAGTVEDAEARTAAALWRVQCASCHGVDGRGDGVSRLPAMQLPDFSDASWHARHSDEKITNAISEGYGGMMPAFGDRISPSGIAALVKLIRSQSRE